MQSGRMAKVVGGTGTVLTFQARIPLRLDGEYTLRIDITSTDQRPARFPNDIRSTDYDEDTR
jgi:hypothetical protein